MSALGPRAGGLRLIRLVLVAVAFGTMINTSGGVVLFLLNSDRVDQINEERARNARLSCEDVNARNTAALRELDRLLERTPGRMSAAQVRRSRENTRALIDALAPRRDCAALVAQQVKSNP